MVWVQSLEPASWRDHLHQPPQDCWNAGMGAVRVQVVIELMAGHAEADGAAVRSVEAELGFHCKATVSRDADTSERADADLNADDEAQTAVNLDAVLVHHSGHMHSTATVRFALEIVAPLQAIEVHTAADSDRHIVVVADRMLRPPDLHLKSVCKPPHWVQSEACPSVVAIASDCQVPAQVPAIHTDPSRTSSFAGGDWPHSRHLDPLRRMASEVDAVSSVRVLVKIRLARCSVSLALVEAVFGVDRDCGDRGRMHHQRIAVTVERLAPAVEVLVVVGHSCETRLPVAAVSKGEKAVVAAALLRWKRLLRIQESVLAWHRLEVRDQTSADSRAPDQADCRLPACCAIA